MQLTPDVIISTVCETLKLDRDKLTSEKLTDANKDYYDAKMICSHILRRKVFTTKVIMGTTADGKRARMEDDKPITYQKIAYIFKRKAPQTVMASELKCNDLLKTDKTFKEKYDYIISLLDSKVNIA